MYALVKRNLYNSASKEITINVAFFLNGRRGETNKSKKTKHYNTGAVYTES
jgi:hypothetical protein